MASVQKMASLMGVLQINGTIQMGICAIETSLSAVHMRTWSPELLLESVVENEEVAGSRLEGEVILDCLIPVFSRLLPLIKRLHNILILL